MRGCQTSRSRSATVPGALQASSPGHLRDRALGDREGSGNVRPYSFREPRNDWRRRPAAAFRWRWLARLVGRQRRRAVRCSPPTNQVCLPTARPWRRLGWRRGDCRAGSWAASTWCSAALRGRRVAQAFAYPCTIASNRQMRLQDDRGKSWFGGRDAGRKCRRHDPEPCRASIAATIGIRAHGPQLDGPPGGSWITADNSTANFATTVSASPSASSTRPNGLIIADLMAAAALRQLD